MSDPTKEAEREVVRRVTLSHSDFEHLIRGGEIEIVLTAGSVIKSVQFILADIGYETMHNAIDEADCDGISFLRTRRSI